MTGIISQNFAMKLVTKFDRALVSVELPLICTPRGYAQSSGVYETEAARQCIENSQASDN